MKAVNLNSEEFESVINEPIFTSRSSAFYRFNNQEVFKCFGRCPHDYLHNKEYVLSSLQYYSEKIKPLGLVLPNELVKEEGILRGFTMDYIEDGVCLNKKLASGISAQDKIDYLKRVGQILESMKVLREKEHIDNFFLSDIHEENILIDESDKLHIVDIDSVQIFSSKPFSAKYLRNTFPISNYLNKYKWYYGYIWGEYYADYNTEIYCYIIMILNMILDMPSYKLTLSEYYRCINLLNKLGIPIKLTEMFKRVYSYDDNVNPYELLDGLGPYLEDNGPAKIKRLIMDK